MANTKITNPKLFNLGASTSATQLPVMTLAQRTAMTGVSTGEMIFNSTTDKVEYWDGTKWYGITYEVSYPSSLKIYLDASNTASYDGTGTTWSDLTSNANNGALVNMTSANWNSGGYFQFDGSNEYVNLTGQAPFSNSTTQTNDIKCFTGWIKLDAGTRAMLYTASSTTNYNDYFSCQIRNTSPFIFLAGRNGTSSNQFLDAVSYTPNTDWHHYVFQLTGTTREIYIDGVSRTISRDNRGSATNTSWVSFPSYASATTHAIQQGRASSAYYGYGKVSKVKYYSSPLTQAEITALYNEGE